MIKRKEIDLLTAQYQQYLSIGNVRASGAVLPVIINLLYDKIEELEKIIKQKEKTEETHLENSIKKITKPSIKKTKKINE